MIKVRETRGLICNFFPKIYVRSTFDTTYCPLIRMTTIRACYNPMPKVTNSREVAKAILLTRLCYDSLNSLILTPRFTNFSTNSQLTRCVPLTSSTPSHKKSLISLLRGLHIYHGTIRREKWLGLPLKIKRMRRVSLPPLEKKLIFHKPSLFLTLSTMRF